MPSTQATMKMVANPGIQVKLCAALMKSKLVLPLLICCAFVGRLNATGNGIDHELKSRYRNQILAFKYPFLADSQEYDATGTPINPGVEGPWTIYGRVKIRKIKLDDHKLVMEGVRQIYRIQGNGLEPANWDHNAHITLRLAAPALSIADAETVMRRVFDLSTDEIVQSAPEYWRDYLIAASKNLGQAKMDPPAGVALMAGGKGITPPHAIFTPEPDYTELARKARFQGEAMYAIVVSGDGSVSSVKILRPLGFGLDDSAVHKIKTWRFEPARKNGDPRPVMMAIEVAFNMYFGRGEKP